MGQLEECEKGFGLGKGNEGGLKEVEGERKGEDFLEGQELGEIERVYREK